MRWEWLKRRWYEFRTGHSTYCVFLLSFANFIIISYSLLIERIDFLKSIFTHMTIYALVFLAIYVPLTTLIGHLHRKKQLRVDIAILSSQNPFFRDLAKALYLLCEGNTDQAKEILAKWADIGHE